MSLIPDIEKLRAYPAGASAGFRHQLEQVREARERLGTDRSSLSENSDRGVDRSSALNPMPRPSIVRTLVDA